MDPPHSLDAHVSRFPNFAAILGTPSNSDSPAPSRPRSPPYVSDFSLRSSPGPTRRRDGRRGAHSRPPYVCTRGCSMNHRHIRPCPSPFAHPRRSSSRNSDHGNSSPPSSRRGSFHHTSPRGSARRPTPRSSGSRRPFFSNPRANSMASSIRPLFYSRLVVVTINNNEVIDVASFTS